MSAPMCRCDMPEGQHALACPVAMASNRSGAPASEVVGDDKCTCAVCLIRRLNAAKSERDRALRERDEAREEAERLAKINSGLVHDFNTLLRGGEVEVTNAEALVHLVDKAMLAEGLHMTVRAKLRVRVREALRAAGSEEENR